MAHLLSNAEEGTYGVDRIKVRFKMSSDTTLSSSLEEGLFGEPGRSSGYVQGAANWAYARWEWQRGFLSLEFNPADSTYAQSGLRLCPFSSVSDVCASTIREILYRADPTCTAEFQQTPWTGDDSKDFPPGWGTYIHLSEIDLTRDFVVGSPFTLEMLQGRVPHYTRKSATYADSNGIIETVTHPYSTDTFTHKFYDKHRKETSNGNSNSKGFLPRTFRYEVTVPRKKLRHLNLSTLDDLSETGLASILTQCWQRSRYGEPLQDSVEPLRRITTRHPGPHGLELIGFANAYASGVALDGTSQRKVQGLRQELNAIGLKAKVPLSLQGREFGFLDFESGTLRPLD